MAWVVVTYTTRISRVVLFWIVFVLTRPLGATLGDLLTKPLQQGGLGFGTIGSSAVLITVLVSLIFYSGWLLRRRPRLAEETAE